MKVLHPAFVRLAQYGTWGGGLVAALGVLYLALGNTLPGGLLLLAGGGTAWTLWPYARARRSVLHRLTWTGLHSISQHMGAYHALAAVATAAAVALWTAKGPVMGIPALVLAGIAAWQVWQARGRPIVIGRDGVKVSPSPPPDGVLVGRLARITPATPQRRVYTTLTHVVYVAPSGTGKSQTIEAALLEWPHQAIVIDPKGEFRRDIAEERARRTGRPYRVWGVDAAYDDIGPHRMVPWKKILDLLTQAIEPDPGYVRGLAFTVPAVNALTAIGLDAEAQGKRPWHTIASTRDWQQALDQIAKTSPSQEARNLAANALRAAVAPGYWGSIMGNIGRYLPALAALGPALDGKPLTPEEDVYIFLPATAAQHGAVGAVIARFLLAVVWEWKAEAEQKGLSWPTLLVVDEASALSMPALQTIGRLGRSAGVRGWFAYQDRVAGWDDPNLNRLPEQAGALLVWYPPQQGEADPATRDAIRTLLPNALPKEWIDVAIRAVVGNMTAWRVGVAWSAGTTLPITPILGAATGGAPPQLTPRPGYSVSVNADPSPGGELLDI